jgi:hypothetical protein
VRKFHKEKYFEGVASEVWEFKVSGYQVIIFIQQIPDQ